MPVEYWTKERVIEEAKKYDSRSAFRKGNAFVYGKALRKDWHEAFEDMPKFSPGRKPIPRFVYVVTAKEDSVTYVYVGLSKDAKARVAWHKRFARIDRKMLLFSKPNCKIKVMNNGESMLQDDAARLEYELVEKYRRNKRYVVLNNVAGGNHLGGNTLKWTDKALRLEAKKYDTRSAFREGSQVAYITASRRDLLDKICKHMTSPRVPRGYWDSRANCEAAADKCKTKSEFSVKFVQAYYNARVNGWLGELFP